MVKRIIQNCQRNNIVMSLLFERIIFYLFIQFSCTRTLYEKIHVITSQNLSIVLRMEGMDELDFISFISILIFNKF